jgi:hypothetical protein
MEAAELEPEEQELSFLCKFPNVDTVLIQRKMELLDHMLAQ